ncbi:MAG: hypothetical protein V3U60_12400, partial [Gammaproteobacteria bacterium]
AHLAHGRFSWSLRHVAQILPDRIQAGEFFEAPLCLLVPSKVDRRTATGRELAAALERFDEPVGPEIGQRAALVDAFSVGAWIGQYAPRSEARGQFRDLATAVKRRWLMELRRLRSGGDDQRQKNIGVGVEFKVAKASEAPALR